MSVPLQHGVGLAQHVRERRVGLGAALGTEQLLARDEAEPLPAVGRRLEHPVRRVRDHATPVVPPRQLAPWSGLGLGLGVRVGLGLGSEP